MMPSDRRQPKQAAYPFLIDSRISSSMRKHYLAWRSFEKGDVRATVEEVAEKLGVDRRTVMRTLRKLQGIGLIQVTEQFQGGRQRRSLYTFPEPDWWVDPGPFEGGQNGQNGSVDGCQKTRWEGGQKFTVGSRDACDGDPEEPSWVVSPSQSPSHPSLVPGEPRWPYTHRHSWELVEFFTDHVGARDIREKGRVRKISAQRLGKWIDSANHGLDEHPLDELQAVVTWIFTQHLGQLPFPVVNKYIGRLDPRERRVTRLAQILDHYPELLAMMNRRLEIVPDPVAQPAKEITISKSQAYYDYGEGFPFEDQVTELVELFAKTKRREVSEINDFVLFEWRKSFRIMLGSRGIPFDDIVTVVTALGNTRLHLDFARYHAPYDMYRDDRPGEWEKLLGRVKLALKWEQPTPAPSPRRHFDDDDYFPRIGADDDDDDDVQSSNMADSVEARRRRYEARQRHRQSPWDDEARWA